MMVSALSRLCVTRSVCLVDIYCRATNSVRSSGLRLWRLIWTTSVLCLYREWWRTIISTFYSRKIIRAEGPCTYFLETSLQVRSACHRLLFGVYYVRLGSLVNFYNHLISNEWKKYLQLYSIKCNLPLSASFTNKQNYTDFFFLSCMLTTLIISCMLTTLINSMQPFICAHCDIGFVESSDISLNGSDRHFIVSTLQE